MTMSKKKVCIKWTIIILFLRSITILQDQIDADIVKKTHFGGFDDDEEDENVEVGQNMLRIVSI